ncbi:E3 ubiquitin-protein ligase AIRP2 isoform X2 [Abrus precatorius]|uniref:E3 ubiquitin-protein ligase AIRP2 isoform X2 n=1 Tax=Abrus precatorius TaxID=3816 RepID=A0A8B8K226_ABRPR|nr:E3 ubiquitin-protein ligase AIRP2 isoform X2 [Abrus precatorius]
MQKIFPGKYLGMGKCSFQDSLKALEADIQYANTLALGHPRDKDGGCFQMRLSYSPAAPIFLFLVQWTDYRLAGALGLLRILIYVTYGNGNNTMSIYERRATIRQFYTVIFPALLQLQKGITDLEERKQKEVYALRYQRRSEFRDRRQSEIDIEREEECGVCLEVKAKVVLPNCCHYMCLECYRDWCLRSLSCPFCRDSLKRVNSGDLWIYTDISDIVDVETIFKENCKMLYLYIEKLPLIVPDPRHVSFDPFLR